jgi:phage terminase large subunit GpA-like protein
VYDPDKKRYIPRLGQKHKRNEPLDTLVYAWAIGQHRDINLGRGRTGRPDPKYWERLEVMLESGEKVEVEVRRESLDKDIAASKPVVHTPARPAPKPAAPRSKFVKEGWRGFK